MATVHGDDITIGGQRTAAEFLIKMISKKYEIRKQVLGRDPDLEKSGRILNRVIEYPVGITIQADQRHVREIMNGFELERANHSTTPCDLAGMDESKGENRCRRGQAKHRWNHVYGDDDKDRPRMADDDANDSQALTGGNHTIPSTRCADQLPVTRPSRSQVRIDESMLCDGKTLMRDMECAKPSSASHERSAGHGMRQENWQVKTSSARNEQTPGQSPGGLGKAKHVDMRNLWIQEASMSGRFTTKKVGTSVNPADLMTKPVSKARNEQFMSLMGYEFVDNETSTSKGQPTTTQGL